MAAENYRMIIKIKKLLSKKCQSWKGLIEQSFQFPVVTNVCLQDWELSWGAGALVRGGRNLQTSVPQPHPHLAMSARTLLLLFIYVWDYTYYFAEKAVLFQKKNLINEETEVQKG